MEEKVFQGRLEEKSKGNCEPVLHEEQPPTLPACLLRDVPTTVLLAEDDSLGLPGLGPNVLPQDPLLPPQSVAPRLITGLQ